MVLANSLTALCLILSTSLLVVNSIPPPIPLVDGGQLLMGKSLGFFDTRDEAIEKVGERKVVDVKGKTITEEGEKTVDGNDNLEMGTLVQKFDKRPPPFALPPYTESAKGKMLSEDVQSGSYVANPAKVLGEILATGADIPEVVDGEVIAGDAAELDVLNFLN